MDRQKQQQFFEDTIEQYKGILFKVARAYFPNEEDRQDLIQEMMIQIWQSIHKYNNQYKISTWLYCISLNVAISFYRKASTRAKKFTVLNEQIEETPVEELARAYRRIFSRKAQWQIMNLASEFGDKQFRETISNMLNQNRRMQTCVPEICITRGSQMALFLTAHSLLEKGDIILVENPGYSPAWHTGKLRKIVDLQGDSPF